MSQGFEGFIDFVGFPAGAGVPLPIPPAGLGFNDFFTLGGLYAGQGTASAPSPIVIRGHGFRGAGPFISYMMVADKKRRERLRIFTQQSEGGHVVRSLIEANRVAQKVKNKRLTEDAMFSVLLSEL